MRRFTRLYARVCPRSTSGLFFFNDTATTEIYTLSLHDALPIHRNSLRKDEAFVQVNCAAIPEELIESELFGRSEEHTSELQSLAYLVCRLLLEKKKKNTRHSLRY